MTLPHRPTKITKEKVFDFKSFGVTNEEIATYLDISIETLTKYYKKELAEAVVEANTVIAQSLYAKAKKGDVQAQMFWLKTRARWRTTDSIHLIESNEDLKQELIELRKKLEEQSKKDY